MTGGEGTVTYQWNADGDVIFGATKATLKVTEDMTGSALSVTVTDAAGNVAVSAATAIVKSDYSGSVEIYDQDGLQTDGTGVVGDTLRLTYGSGLGTPEEITWYYNEKVVQTGVANSATDLNALLLLDTGGPVKKNGEYYAVIKNQGGDVFTSNTITLVYDELKAVVSDFAIEDDYTEPENIDPAAKDTKAVLSVTLSKDYYGTFYVYDGETVKYSTTAIEAIDNTYATQYASASNPWQTWKEVNNSRGLTAKKAIEASPTFNGIKYVAPTGETTYMWKTQSTAGLERGKTYKIAFDQEGVDTDNITATARTDIEVSDAVTMEYLDAPDAIEVTTAAAGQSAVVTLKKDGETLAYLGNGRTTGGTVGTTVGGAGFDSIIVKSNGSAKTDGAVTNVVSAGSVDKGVYQSDNAITKDSYYYAIAKTTAGVFSNESITLTSGFKAANVAISDIAGISQNSSVPTQADVSLSGVVAPATVYIVDETNVLAGTFDTADPTSYRGKASVKAGQGDVSISGVFKPGDVVDDASAPTATSSTKFITVVIPEDQNTYAKVSGDITDDDKCFKLEQKATSVQIGELAFAASVTGNTTTIEGLVAYDQFGLKMLKAATGRAAVTAIDSKTPVAEGAEADYTITAGLNALVLSVKDESVVGKGGGTANQPDKGDGYSISVLGSTVKMTSVSGGAIANDNWKVVVDGTKVLDGSNGQTIAGYTFTPATFTGAQAMTTGTAIGTLSFVNQFGTPVAISEAYNDGATVTATTITDSDGTAATETVGFGIGTDGRVYAKGSATLAGVTGTYTEDITVNGQTFELTMTLSTGVPTVVGAIEALDS